MASKALTNIALQLYKSLGGNLSSVLGTRSNINFLGKGKSPELMVDMDINPEALGVLSQSKAVGELESAMGYLTAGKLNDVQANKLISNMKVMKDFYMPPAAPANITDLATGTRGLNKEGLESLRAMADDLPPPGSRGGADDIAGPTLSDANAPFTGAGLEAIKNVKGSNLIVDDIVNKIYLNAGVAENAQPVVRANAREFLNRIKDLEDPTFPEGPTLASAMTKADFKAMTEGGGGGMGDPLLLVQKYFGPRVASAVAKLDGPNEIQLFAERLVTVTDDAGRTITDRRFNPETVDIEDFEFADGGLARLGYRGGKLVGKALGMFKRQQALERGAGEGFAAVEQYGITGKDVSRLFAELASDKSLVGKEKTAYMKLINEVLKNPEKYPEEILKIQKRLGIEIDDIGMKSGGLAKILEV